jgi:CubicO group peptidase (beta-lactamase class C family)
VNVLEMKLKIQTKIIKLVNINDTSFNNKLSGKFTVLFIVSLMLLNVFIFPASSEVIKKSLNIDSDELKIDDFKFNLKLRIFERLARSQALSFCIIKNNSIVYYDSFEHSNSHSLKSISKDTVFMLSSVTKTITATALLQLYENGCVDLDKNISEYLPFDLKNPKYPDVNITLRMLLYHRSSIQDSFLYDIKEAIGLLSKNPFKYNTEELLKEMLIPGGKLYKSDH